MKHAALILLAATGAHAQTWTWLADVENPIIDPDKGVTTQTVTLTALMEHDTPYVAIGAVIFDTLGALNAEIGHIVDWQVLNDLDELTGDLTTTDGVSLYGTNAGQLCATFGPCNHDNPIDVLEFTWQLNDGVDLDAPIEVNYVTLTEVAVVMAGEDQDSADFIEVEVIHDALLSWTVVPGPHVLALGLCALPVALARRR